VADGTAAILSEKNRKYFSSPLVYLSHFPYGTFGYRSLDERSAPAMLELNISKAPRVGEEAVVTCRVTSLHDETNVRLYLVFSKFNKGFNGTPIPAERILVKGEPGWVNSASTQPGETMPPDIMILENKQLARVLDLKQGEPLEFSFTVKFPEEGDWLIHGQGDFLNNNRGGFAEEMKININRDRGSFGWIDYRLTPPF
jgi:hypothetical protein